MDKLRCSLSKLIILTSIWVLMTGCAGNISNALTTKPTPTPITECVPSDMLEFYSKSDSGTEIRRPTASELANSIFSEYKLRYLNNDQPGILSAKNQALQFLAYETKRWSHIGNESGGTNRNVRISITFISPELVRAVILNYVIFNLAPNQNQNFDITAYTHHILANMDARAKYIFLIAIQPEMGNLNGEALLIPSHISIYNINGSEMNKSKIDYFMNLEHDYSEGQHTGFAFFPFGKIDENGRCIKTLDPEIDTSITLVIEDARFAENREEDVVSEIPFSPALPLIGNLIPTPNPYPPTQIQQDFTPLTVLPALSSATPEPGINPFEDLSYWMTLGRFVWGKLTLDYFAFR